MERIGVLFVCLGNICRSPLAEGVFRHLVTEKGMEERFLIDSAGTSTWHLGKPPHELSPEVCRLGGFEIDSQRARQVSSEDFQTFHYILGMDKNNLFELRRIKPEGAKAKVGLILTYSDLSRIEVPDPYYGGLEEFEDVLFLVKTGAEGLLEVIERDHFS